MNTLHITNGDSAVAAIRNSGIKGEIISWDDFLHDGPVPGGKTLAELSAIRAEFISSLGWESQSDVSDKFYKRDRIFETLSDFDETVLWFEHDLYDQLQLIQVLSEIEKLDYNKIQISHYFTDEYLSEVSLDSLLKFYKKRSKIKPSILKYSSNAWNAFTSETPEKMYSFINNSNDGLPYLKKAFSRICEQYPSSFNGLSRSENQILSDTAGGPYMAKELFFKACDAEESKFLGDWVFALYLETLSNCKESLILLETGDKILFKPGDRSFWKSNVLITDQGKDVLKGKKDNIGLNGIDKWLGGVHLNGKMKDWRWDKEDNRFVS